MEWINLFFITFHLAFRFTFFQKHMRLNAKNDFQKLYSLVQSCGVAKIIAFSSAVILFSATI